MGYRGEDLDLRTTRTWSGRGEGDSDTAGPDAILDPLASPPDGHGPIWVDDLLLSCCNHAYEIALAHRSGEVRIEHLLYALTRVEEAAEVLESYRIRVASLRRECGIVIAVELPVGLDGEDSAPRRQPALEDALRTAAHLAFRRKSPAGVADLLQVFVDLRPDLPGLDLLHRFSLVNNRDYYRSRSSAFEPDYNDYSTPRERPRRPARPSYPDEHFPSASAVRYNIPQPLNDNTQNARLDALVRMIQTLSDDLAKDRDNLTSTFKKLQRDLGNPPTSGASSTVIESIFEKIATRLDALEQVVREETGESGRSLSAVSARLESVENRIADNRDTGVDLGPIEDRLGEIESAFLSLSSDTDTATRIDALEATLVAKLSEAEERANAATNTQLEARAHVLSVIESSLAGLTTSREAAQALREKNAQRLEAIETLLSRQTQPIDDTRQADLLKLDEVHQAIMTLNENQHTLAMAIQAFRSASVEHVQAIETRLARIDASNEAPVAQLHRMSQRVDDLHRAALERDHRRNRFWYWLFGTNDWLAASWPNPVKQTEEDLRAIKDSASST
ncbi:Clp protease N-terminal domain-containing protein [Filomicrobium sp.]|uniref:Clp protease N-terminal domain-containing protein n=1 Tax=Filomicrobium sp. TaxID=2024831 RepID=UPI00258C5931|nr:Clp protease N-terminal domain-containing protein [Filomicrobium sp.]MCV0368796.1 hypothetical protein [Filomicrobium sp.]